MPRPASGPRCAVYTRKSSEEGLEQAFNSLDAQREACEAYVKSQAGEGWTPVKTRYDDGGVSGGTMERPALRQLLANIEAGGIDTVVVYKVDRLTRSLADFAKIVEVLDARGVSFVSVTQQFNTTTSMGQLTLNMLLSFAQFEREVTGERIRDKIAASKKKGMWMGGFVLLGYDANERSLVINEQEAETVRTVFRLYLDLGNVRHVKEEADRLGLATKLRRTEDGRMRGGRPLRRGTIYKLLGNPIYAGRIAHKDTVYEGQHEAIVDADTWEAAQARLAGNACNRLSGTHATEPSLLAGLLYDERGNRLSPSHAVKNGVRYRYYVSQAVLQHRDSDSGSVSQIPAREIEELVCTRITVLLEDPAKVIDELTSPGDSARDQHRLLAAAAKRAKSLPQLSACERRSFLRKAVGRVSVRDSRIEIVLSRRRLRAAILEQPEPARITATGHEGLDALTLRVDAKLKLCSGEMRLVLPPGQSDRKTPRPNPTLVKALTRAHEWKGKLFSGAAVSIRALATEEGLPERYVSRLLRLAFLAPDIIEAILEGHQPVDLELERLLQGSPLCWAEQRRVFGFEARA